MTTLKDLPIGKTATVVSVGGEGALRQHFLDMGIIPEADVTMVKHAPMGDPVELRIHGYELTLRLDDAARIEVCDVRDGERPARIEHRAVEPLTHPGLGESGKRFHDKATEHPLPEGEVITFALAGNQNCGKTTLFNQLTGANQHVGNFPGVTVDRKDGAIKGHPETLVTDLPGIYSMSPYTSEEIVTRAFLLDEHPRGIINIVDATNIERNLYLTMQLMELGIPMVLALNMMDEVTGNGGSVRVNEMEELLGIPVVPIVASKAEGVPELIDHALHVAKFQESPVRQDFCSPEDHGGAVHRCLHSIMHLIEDHAARAGIPVRFAASKLAEGDELVLDALDLDQNEKEMLEHIIVQMETERGLDRAAAVAEMRFSFINRICAQTVVKPRESREHKRSQAADRILTGRFTAIPAFIAIMAVVFWLTFNVIGAWLQELLDEGIGWLSDAVASLMAAGQVNEVLQSLVVDGIFNGVGSVVSFVPIIVVLFFFLSLLEDSGYMARVAFVMDRPMRKIGLSGRSIVPLLMGFGCSVPSIMATRTLSSERDRKMTTMLVPFMSCSAKLPIYALLVGAFFPRTLQPVVMIGLYAFGVAVGISFAAVLKRARFRGQPVPFVMELPNYRLPAAKSVARLVWDKAKGFVKKAFTVVLAACVVIWFLQTFDARLNVVDDVDASLLAGIGGLIAPLFAPLGFGDWRAATALMTGFMAKESVVSTLTQVMGEGVELTMLFTPVTAMAFLAFVLLYTPCVAAIATVRSEQGGARAALEMVLLQCGIAWVVSFAVYLAGSLVTGGIADAFSLPGLVAAGVIAVGIGVYLKRQRTDGELRVGCKTCPANCKNSSGCCH